MLPDLLDSKLVLSYYSGNRNSFKEYNEFGNEDSFLDEIESRRLTDEEARTEINKAISGYEIAGIKSLPRIKRDEIVTRVKKIAGIIQRRLSRILGISLSLINKPDETEEPSLRF